MHKLRLSLVCALLLLVASEASAGGVMREGIGAVSTGRGATNMGFADNGVILYDNPAAMVNIPGTVLAEAGLDILLTDLQYSDPYNATAAKRRPFPLPYLSLMRRSDDGRSAVGLGIFAPAGFGAEYRKANPNVTPLQSEHRYRSLGALLTIQPGVSYRLTDRLAAGGTLGVAVGHAELEGPFWIQDGPLTGTPTLMDMRATGASLTWSAGLQYELTDRLTLGAAYRSQNRMRMDGTAQVEVFGLGHTEYDAEVTMTWPQSVSFGGMYRLAPHRRLAVDAVWFDWSGAFDHIGMRMTNPDDPAFQMMAGTVDDQFPLRWRDAVAVRAGYEQDLCPCMTIRVGYVYHRNPIPEKTLTPFIPAIIEHAVTVGLGQQFGASRFDVAYQHAFGNSTSVGQSDLVGGNFDNSDFRSSAHWLLLSFGYLY
jgi:long-chain fatty acid transport protein